MPVFTAPPTGFKWPSSYNTTSSPSSSFSPSSSSSITNATSTISLPLTGATPPTKPNNTRLYLSLLLPGFILITCIFWLFRFLRRRATEKKDIAAAHAAINSLDAAARGNGTNVNINFNIGTNSGSGISPAGRRVARPSGVGSQFQSAEEALACAGGGEQLPVYTPATQVWTDIELGERLPAYRLVA